MQDLLAAAIERRRPLLARAEAEGTDALRLLHGIAEGAPGTAVDRYGPVLLVQTWREPLPAGALDRLHATAERELGVPLLPVWNHRPAARDGYHRLHPVELPEEIVARELGIRFDARPRHRGHDPLLFLDLRVLRRRVLAHGARTVLNLFGYTCGIGTAALRAGAEEVWNVDFAASALEVGVTNARLNGLDVGRLRQVHHDALPVLRQLAGAHPGRRRPTVEVEPRTFELVVLDPPAFSKGPWGAVDVVRDYPTLLKPALACTSPGGVLAVTHHVASVPLPTFLDTVRQTASRLGREVEIEVLRPEEDFPSFDDAPPLKIAWVRA